MYVILNGKTYGGSEKHVVDLINNLPNEFEPMLIMSNCIEMYKQINKQKCKKIYLVNRNSPFIINKIRRIIENEVPEIVHAHAARGMFLARIAVKPFVMKNKVKLICTAHGWVLSYLSFHKLKEKLFLMNRDLDAFTIAVSRYSMDEMIRYGYNAKKICYIYNGIDTDYYNKRARLKETVNNICYIGRFTNQKGIVFLMDVIATMNRNTDIRFSIYGSGEEEDFMRDYISKKHLRNVKIYGFVIPEKVVDVLNEADLLILPSIDEGFPYILVEAIASGVPCVATNVGGVGEIIDGTVGRVVQPRDANAILDGINEVIHDDVKELSRNCLKKSEHFSVSKMVDRTVDVYRGTIV